MRIDTSIRSSGVSGRAATGKVSSGAVFVPMGEGGPTRVADAAPLAAMTGLDAILALQTVGDFRESRRKNIRRGNALLDLLENMKADLLVGQASPDRLTGMIAQLASMRERVDPELDAVMDDIELRVRVELAKLGHYPAL